MANKNISQLTAATEINNADLFVLEQGGVAKKLAGSLLLATIEAHGGIASTSYTAPVAPSLEGTLTLTYADGTSDDIPIYNGAKGDTGATGATGYSPVATVEKVGHRATITITDQNGTTSAYVQDGNDGQHGQDGNPGYCWIKWASDQPTSDNDLSDIPDAWMGIYSGSSSTAPTAYTAYTWYKIKGDNGDKGDPGVGVPPRGDSGQVLAKKTATSYDTEWVDPEKGIFTAVENETEFGEIYNAWVAGKTINAVDSARANYYTLLQFEYDSESDPPVAYATFYGQTIDRTADLYLHVDSNGWDSRSYNHLTEDNAYSAFPTATGSGASVTTMYGADDIPVKSLVANIDLEQSGSGDPSENNIRPITCHQSAEVYVSPTADPDDGATYEFSWDEPTIGAGTLNAVFGVLTQTRIVKEINGTESWTLSTANGYRRFYKSLSALGWPAMDATAYTASVSSHFIRKSSSTQTTDTFGAFRISQDGYVVLPDNGSRFASADELKAWFAAQYEAETPVQFSYVLDEPETFFVEPQYINTYLGENHIWASTGNVSVTYREDIALLIAAGGGGGGTSDYTQLTNKPSIESVTLSGNKTAADLGLAKSSDIPSAATATPLALGTAAVGSSAKYAKEDHVHPLPLKYTTLTIATTDWSSLSCTKTVTGMTSTAIVWLEYSDTTTAFTCTQGTDSLTFGCDATPSAAVTVKVAFMEGISL